MVTSDKKQERVLKTLDKLMEQLETSVNTVKALDKTISDLQEQEEEFREHVRAAGFTKKLLKIGI